MNSSSVRSPSWSTSNFPKIFCNFRKSGKNLVSQFFSKKSNMFAFQISILGAYVRSLHCHVMVQALRLVYCGKHLKQLQNFTHVNTSINVSTAPWSFLGCQLCRNCPCRKAGTPSAVCPWVERIWILAMQYFLDQTVLGTKLSEWHYKFWGST